ncbi:PI-PLC domain-containing protein [Parafrankia elaeagni]|uniref:membrane protein n=1 Tax=Parafrankia elaeagni TaxID=222534 RepID=UPI00039BAE6E|nr:membrane protein [Parafrankia elaeagni]
MASGLRGRLLRRSTPPEPAAGSFSAETPGPAVEPGSGVAAVPEPRRQAGPGAGGGGRGQSAQGRPRRGGSPGRPRAAGGEPPTGGKRLRAAQWALAVLLALVWLPVVVLTTARTTVLSADFYSQALSRADAYDRLYTEVLPDPAVDGLLSGLPIDSTLVTANLRTVLPPSTVEEMTNEQIRRVVDYLAAREDDLAFSVDLTPIFGNISGLANRYIAGELGSGTSYRVESVTEFTRAVLTAIDEIMAGRPPADLPTMELSAQDTDRVVDAVLGRLPPAEREEVAGPLRADLRSGNIAGALALIGPLLFQGDEQAIGQLQTHLADGAVLDLGLRLSDLREEPAISAVSRLHDVAAALDGLTVALLALVGLIGAGIVMVAGARGRSRIRAVAGAVLTAGVAAALLGLVLRITLPNPLLALEKPGGPLPPGAGAVLADFSRHAYGDIEADFLRIVGWTLVVGGVVLGAAFLLRVSRAWSQAGRRRRLVAGLAVTVPVMTALTWLAFPGAAANARDLCNSQTVLCDRRYDEVTNLAAHNAMATSEDRFLGPTQDPSLVHQLDLGVRGLLIDVHHWTTPEQVDAVLATLPPSTRSAIEPLTRNARSSRPGLWLCHNLCQLGALELSAELARVGEWMARNPTEVVTLLIQDQVPAPEIAGAVAQAGLSPLVVTPPAEGERWPRLREMIESGRRLVVFTESQDLPGTFLRSFYRYASDTPFSIDTTDKLTGCARERGSAGAPLLLLNHWVTDAAPSRQAALVANSAESILGRARACESAQGRRPTFIAVDFVNIGNASLAIDRLNGAG